MHRRGARALLVALAIPLASARAEPMTAAGSPPAPAAVIPEPRVSAPEAPPPPGGGPAPTALTFGERPTSRLPGSIQARRARAKVAVDGRLDDEPWQHATPFDALVQLQPDEGSAPSERTEVRVVFDDRYLYVGIRCRDSWPHALLRPLGRRDSAPYSDKVTVLVDAAHDHRNALLFAVTAGGVQEDGRYFDDDGYRAEWDAAWEAAAATGPDGWSAELAIPLSALPIPAAGPAQVWGFAVKRDIARLREVASSVLFPGSATGVASRLGHMTFSEPVSPRREGAVVPYAATRLLVRPSSDPTEPRVSDPIADLGLDLKLPVGGGLALDATVNPDFGQVEADQLQQNLTTFEASFPEKRPFFLQGMELFQPVGSGRGKVPHQLLYSRRIGLSAPILGAAKLSGSASDRLQIAALDAFVTGPGRPEASERRLVFLPSRPLHFAPEDTLPARAPASQNFFAGVARYHPSSTATYGATVTSALPVDGRCTAADAALQGAERPAACDAQGGNAAAADWNLRSAGGDWALYGQASGSQVVGGPPDRVLADGTHLGPGDLGYGAYLTAGRFGGEPWRVRVDYQHSSPRLDLNASGFQPSQNEQVVDVGLQHVRSRAGGRVSSWGLYLDLIGRWTTDGRQLERGKAVVLTGQLQLRQMHSASCSGGWDDPEWDVREIFGRGVAYRRLPSVYLQCSFSTDPGRALSLDGGLGAYRSAAGGPLDAADRLNGNLGLTWRPHRRLESRVWLSLNRDEHQARWLGGDPDAAPADGPAARPFADLDASSLSLVLRQNVSLTPRLTLQGYAQLFGEYGRYGQYYTTPASALERGGRVEPGDLRPVDVRPELGWQPDFHASALNVNVVLRWEYRPGATLYAVYGRSQTELPWTGSGSPPASVLPGALGAGPAVDSFMLKWAWWWRV